MQRAGASTGPSSLRSARWAWLDGGQRCGGGRCSGQAILRKFGGFRCGGCKSEDSRLRVSQELVTRGLQLSALHAHLERD